jgi:hypothetical protein
MKRGALRQGADVLGVEAVDVLLGRDRLKHLFFVEVLGQRQLHQDAVDGRVGIQLGDLVEHLAGRHHGRKRSFRNACRWPGSH